MAAEEHPIKLDVVTPERYVYSDYVDEVYAPGELGPFGVLPGHTTYFSSVSPGVLHFRRGTDTTYMAVTRQGFVEVLNNVVTVLVDTAEMSHEIDVARAEAAKERAEAEIEKVDGVDVIRATAAMDRALLRLRVAKMS